MVIKDRVVFKAIWQVIPTMLCFGWIMSEHRHVSGGTRVCFGWNTSKSPKRGLGTDLTEEVGYFKY